jgi:hypothetical protein
MKTLGLIDEATLVSETIARLLEYWDEDQTIVNNCLILLRAHGITLAVMAREQSS